MSAHYFIKVSNLSGIKSLISEISRSYPWGLE